METNEDFCGSIYSRQYSENEIGHVTEVWDRKMCKMKKKKAI
jgi:hypothetical protein